MRIKIILYVVAFTYLSLIFIMNGRKITELDFIFTKFDVSIILIFIISLLLGGIFSFFLFSRRIFQLKRKVKQLSVGHDAKQEKENNKK